VIRVASSRRAFAALLLLLGAAWLPAAAQTQTGAVRGTVTDANGRALGGALVQVDDARSGAATDRDGTFRIASVSAGSHRLTIRYIGYEPATVSVTVTAGEVATANVQLTNAVAKLGAVLVEGQVAGQAAALNQQRTSGSISSVIDNELVGRLPDPNLAEALARVPGVAVVRDQGEGRFVQIRGTNADLNSISLNGMRVSTPEQNNRQLPMDVIPADQGGAIQISKALTPEMDADAIGGNVNIVTRSARPGQTLLNLTTAGGANSLGGGALVNLGFNAGKRFGDGEKFGAMFGGTYYKNERASQNIEGDWCSQTRNCGVAPSLTSLNAPNLFEYRDYPQVNRQRNGVNATLDYAPNERSKITFRGTWNQFSDDEQRFRTRFRFRGGGGSRWTMVTPDSGVTTGSQMDRDIRLREVIQNIYTAQVAGEHTATSGRAINWMLGTSRASEDRPDVLTMSFRQSGMTLGYNFADAERPRASVSVGSFDDPARFSFNSLTREVRATNDDDVTGKVDVSWPVTLGRWTGDIRAGLAARMKQRSNVLNTTVFTNALGTNGSGATGATLFGTLVSETSGRSLFDGDYNLGRHLDPARTQAFINANPGAFTKDAFNSAVTSAGGTYEVGEDVYAGFLMATLDAGLLRIIPGMRIEATSTDNVAKRVAISGTTATVTDVAGSTNYTNFFPSVNATWRFDELTNLKAAVTTSLVRPQFRDMVPYVNIQVGQQTATIGNPDLKATTALAYDVMVERYFRSVGFVSAGVFYKSLTNFIYPTSRPRLASEQLGADATTVVQPVNGPTATLSGFELAWQQNLSFLPGLLAGLGLNANYTHTSSDAEIPGLGRAGVTTPLPGQTGNAGNLGIFYDRGPLSLRVGANYSGKFLSTINPTTPEGDTRTRERLQWDASGSYRIARSVQLFAEAINLSNTPLRAYVGDQENRGGGGDDPSYEFYKPWAMFGLKLQR